MATLEPGLTQHKQSGQTPNKEVEINHITVYVSGYTETDLIACYLTTTPVWPNKVGLFRAASLARHLVQFAEDSVVAAMDRMYLIALVRDMLPLWDQRDKNYHNRDLKPKFGMK